MLNKIQIEEKSDYLLMKKIFVFAVLIFCLGPWFFTNMISKMHTDLMVQVKCGLWMLENKQLLLDDIFSWHEDLNWCPHETGFYLLTGLAYKIGGAYGCMVLSCISVLCMCCLFYKENGKHSIMSLVISVLLFGRLACGAVYNTRPCVVSTPLMTALMILIWNKADAKKCGIYFCICSLLMAWFHGGMIPLLFVIYVVGVLIDVVYKDFKRVRLLCIYLLVGFALSFCSPIGEGTWTYAATQSQATDVWAYISEWQRGFLDFRASLIFVATTLLFVLTSGVRRFNRTSLIKAAYLCMFAIMFFKYVRFVVLLAVVYMFITPEVFDVLFVWLYKRFEAIRIICSMVKVREFFSNYKLRLSKGLLGVSAVLTLTNAILCGVIFSVLPNNDLNDIAEMSGRSSEIIDFIKERGYTRLYNGYTEGTWLLFNDIKVSQDNRCDPYLKQFSGKQYIRMSESFQALDMWVDTFHPDALLLSYNVVDDSDIMPDNFRIFTEFQTDKYELVFDTVTKSRPYLASEAMLNSGKDCETIHWYIFEVKE